MKDYKTLAARLTQIAEDRNSVDPSFRLGYWVKADLGRLLGLSSGRLTQIYDNPASGLDKEALGRLVKLGYSLEWLETGKGERFVSVKNVEYVKSVTPPEVVQAQNFDFHRIYEALDKLCQVFGTSMNEVVDHINRSRAKRANQELIPPHSPAGPEKKRPLKAGKNTGS